MLYSRRQSQTIMHHHLQAILCTGHRRKDVQRFLPSCPRRKSTRVVSSESKVVILSSITGLSYSNRNTNVCWIAMYHYTHTWYRGIDVSCMCIIVCLYGIGLAYCAVKPFLTREWHYLTGISVSCQILFSIQIRTDHISFITPCPSDRPYIPVQQR